ncbi:hypothetical protein M0R45_002104 [Rubus argutus]|uniref:Uncharacterized protein n=1 Tax=Rubus argutus TaxID=59490 RepID=A0AAW1VJY1_RUBAR
MKTGGGMLEDWMSNMTIEETITVEGFDPMHMLLNLKGVEYDYAYRIARFIRMFDLSSNNLRGEIPEEMTNLTALGSLNLSHNHLTGKIPEGIGSLQRLETLDLSSNHLWGSIPSSMTSMTSLSNLNLSFNNLSGQIPSANQFLTFNSTSFEGNSELCGLPLPTQCSSASKNDHDEYSPMVEEDEEDKYDKIWLYASTGSGFTVGFWVIFGSLVIKSSWRHAYFQFLDKMKVRLSLVVNHSTVKKGSNFKDDQVERTGRYVYVN